MLHVFSFDEKYSTLQTWAQPINLSHWYSPSQVISHVCFVSGNEELLLVDGYGQARIFSLMTQQCRWGNSLKFGKELPNLMMQASDAWATPSSICRTSFAWRCLFCCGLWSWCRAGRSGLPLGNFRLQRWYPSRYRDWARCSFRPHLICQQKFCSLGRCWQRSRTLRIYGSWYY